MGAALARLEHLPLTSFEQYRLAREVLRTEGNALLALSERLDKISLCAAADRIAALAGSLIVTGMGKAGLIGQKLVATFASTGTRAHFLHPAEAVHGDLGRVAAGDLALILSYGGETEEVTRILPTLRQMDVGIIAITGKPQSTLGRASEIVLDLGAIREACPLGLAPSTSTTSMLALGDALALVVSRMKDFGPADFARFHPAGSLGRKLAKVDDVMRPLAECRVASAGECVRDVFVQQRKSGRRAGAVMLVDDRGALAGIFTDSDLARLLEQKRDAAIDAPMRDVMTHGPQTVALGAPLAAALEILSARKISELPVIDAHGAPCGMIDITDVLPLLPHETAT